MPIEIKGVTDTRIGLLSVMLADAASSLSGTLSAPANRDGSIVSSLDDVAASLAGQFGSSASFDGQISATLDNVTALLVEIGWDQIPATLAAGTQLNMLQYLNDPSGLVTATRAMLGGQPLSATTDGSYSHATGILTYPTTLAANVSMEADFSGTATVVATNVTELIAAISQANANGNTTIELADGTYTLSTGLAVSGNNVTVRSQSGIRANVIIEGGDAVGWLTQSASVGQIFTVTGNNAVFQDLTLRHCNTHALQFKAVNAPIVRNCIIRDCYEQFIKVTNDGISDAGIVEDCLVEFTVPAPNFYSGGIDAHFATNWIVRRNTFKNFQSPAGGGQSEMEHAIHFWDGSDNPTIERNTVINCDRGIGAGLGSSFGITGGLIVNNCVVRTVTGNFPDFGITIEASSGVNVYHNTVYIADGAACIDYRYPASDGEVTNNLTNGAIQSRDGGAMTETTNYELAQLSWFADVPNGDLSLLTNQTEVVDQGTALPSVTDDHGGAARPSQETGVWDIGCDEYPIVGTFEPSQLANIFAHTWAGINRVNLTTTTSSGLERISQADDLSGLGNHFINNGNILTRPVSSFLTESGWVAPAASLADDAGSGSFGCWLDQTSSMNATGDFYIAAVAGNQRGGGERYLFGTSTSNSVRPYSGTGQVQITIDGTSAFVAGSGSIDIGTSAPYLLEIFREGTTVTCFVNGQQEGSITLSGNFDLAGVGGFETNAGWDDAAYEYVMCNGNVNASQRTQVRQYLNDRWLVY